MNAAQNVSHAKAICKGGKRSCGKPPEGGGDRAAAEYNGVLFYPICPDEEAKSWAEFGAVIDAFLTEKYAGKLEREKIAYFETLLPSEPDWYRG